MNQIVRKMWEREIYLKDWSAKNGFHPHYVRAVCNGNRGTWRAGIAAKIIRALILDGYIANESDLGAKK